MCYLGQPQYKYGAHHFAYQANIVKEQELLVDQSLAKLGWHDTKEE